MSQEEPFVSDEGEEIQDRLLIEFGTQMWQQPHTVGIVRSQGVVRVFGRRLPGGISLFRESPKAE